MGFLWKTVFAGRFSKTNLFVLAVVASIFSCGLLSSAIYAEEVVENYGLYTAADGVRWEWEVVSDPENDKEPQKINIMFYDKPTDLTTVTVPSYSDMTTLTGVTPIADTYYVRDANQESQDTRFASPDPARRTGGADVTVLDMTNTSKVQILGVKPIINPETEVELIFGENMVIGDAMYISSVRISFSYCTHWRKEYWYEDKDGRAYSYCDGSQGVTLDTSDIPGWDDMTLEERVNYKFSVEDYGYVYLNRDIIYDDEFDPDAKYVTYRPTYYVSTQLGITVGAFSGYKLKLTNFGEFNYVGWRAFYNSTLNEENTTITISGNGFLGEEIFAKTNVKKVILNAPRTGRATFMDCTQLTEVEIGEATNSIDSDMFTNTNLGSLDLSNTNVKTIKYRAFANAHLSSVDLGNVEELGTYAFQDNPSLTEIYLPKSINKLWYSIFDNCSNIKKVTVAYDTLTSGTTIYFNMIFNARAGYLSSQVEELTVLAPYEEGEPLKPTHVTYEDYKYHYDASGNWCDIRCERDGGNNYGSSGYSGYPRDNYQQSEVDYAHVDTYKNVIAPNYFELMDGLKKVTIGDGMEFIGVKAFYIFQSKDYPTFSYDEWKTVLETGKASSSPRLWELSLPDSLKGIGNLAFTGLGGLNLDVNLPIGLEYIGIAAFRGSMTLKGDIDLPNLIFLGDEAFMNTQIRDVVLHDKLQYFGRQVFAGCPYIRNITVDYDLFNPEKNAFHDTTRPTFAGDLYYWYYDKLLNHFGINDDARYLTDEQAEELGMNYGHRSIDGSVTKKFGTIKFTDKVTVGYPEVLYVTGSGSDAHGNYFGYTIADKIDLSETGWTVIPPFFFTATDAGEVLLPHGLTTIMWSAFNSASFDEELVLPDTITTIEKHAFNLDAYNQQWTGNPHDEAIKITHLPTALETVGEYAFFGANGLNTDFNLENVKTIGKLAFALTRLRDITLNSSLESIGEGAFSGLSTLRDIVVDVDLNAISVAQSDFNFAAIFDQNCNAMDVALTANNITFTDKVRTAPTVADVGIRVWPTCEYGYQMYTTYQRTCWYRAEHSETGYDENGNHIYWQNDNGVWYWEFYEITPTIKSGKSSYFFNVTANKIDMSDSNLTELSRSMFVGSKINELLLPENITRIPNSAFYGVEIGGELKIPDSVTYFEDSAFVEAKFDTLILPASLEGSAWDPFWKTEVSETIVVPEGVTALPDNMFIKVHAKKIELPNTLTVIGSSEFMMANIDEELVLPNSLKEIKYNAFNNVKFYETQSANNPDGDPDFYMHVIITKLPESLETIGNAAFFTYQDFSFDLDLPNLKNIEASAFMSSNLENVVLHDKIESIGSGAFQYIPTLKNITIDCDFYNVAAQKYFYGVFSTVDGSYRSGKPYRNQTQHLDRSYFGDIVFTDKNVTNPGDKTGFAFLSANSFDISNVKWTKIPNAFFYDSTVVEPMTVSSSVKEISDEAFEWANVSLTNTFSEGLESIGKGAFYGAQVSGDLTIPSTVTNIGWAAFNAGDADTNYSSVTIKPALGYDSTTSQSIFQIFWNAKMDKLVIESPMLPVLAATGDNPIMPHEVTHEAVVDGSTQMITETPTLRADGEPEFHGMTMKEVSIKNLPVITANAFEECANLTKVDFANHDNLTEIGHHAFNNDTKLKTFVFGDGLVGKDVALKEYAFNNTAVESIGNNTTDFALTAANFHTIDEHVFSNMPKLTTVDIPNNFNIDGALVNADKQLNGSHITAFTFANDPELEQVTIGYQLSEIRDGAFLNDEKLAKLFVWGNAEIQESDDLIRDFNNTTIPKGTTIFGYSDAPSEAYANAASRDDYDGKFYALDEVLYLTSNRAYVVLTEDGEDFKKDGLKLYALRRDGVILESDEWQSYTTAFPRVTAMNIIFEGRGALGDDNADIAANIYDAPKPFNTISLANQNYAATSFEFMQMPSSNNPLVAIHYPDGYTGNIRTTTLASMTEEEEEEMLAELEVPNTGTFLEVVKTATPIVSISAIVVAGVLFITRKRH